MLFRHAVGASVRHLRTELGLTLRELAAASAVSLGYLSEIERGRKEPSSEILAAVCAALDVSVPTVVVAAARRMAAADRPLRAVAGQSGAAA